MAMLNCSYDRLLLTVLYFVLAALLPFCSSAVENCRPCGPGEYCSTFFGICLACKDYCPGDTDCPSACTPIKPNFTTIARMTTDPTSIQSDTTSVASAVVVQQSTNANTPSDGGDITFLDNGKDDSELPAWLSVGFLVALVIIVLLIVVCRKYCKTLKMPSLCCFSSGDSGNRTSIRDTGMTIWTNPMPNQPAECHQTGGYTAVQVDDVDGPNTMDQPGPSSQQNSSRPSRPPGPNVEAPADPPHSASDPRNYTSFAPSTPGPTSIQIHDTSPSTSGVSAVVVQSASIHPQREFETPLGARPSDRLSCPRTPEILRKQTDGTLEGHECSIGASPFEPPNGMCEDNHSAHGD